MRARIVNDERGAALLVALLIGSLLAGLGAVVIAVAITETLVTAAHRQSHEVSSAAEAAFERALLDLDRMPVWDPLLAPAPANVRGTFDDGLANPRAPDGRPLDLGALTIRRQAESDLESGPAAFGADSPSWRLFGHASLSSLLPAGMPAPPAYLVVWVADDGLDGDGNPARDANGKVLLHAGAYGTSGARRAVEGVVWRGTDGVIRVLSRRAR